MNTTYDPPRVCGTGLLPGTRALGERLARLFSVPSPAQAGGYNPRCVYDHHVTVGDHKCPYGHVISFHAESRAFDAMTGDRFVQSAIVDWLLEHQDPLGVQEVICGWAPDTGKPGRWKAGEGWKPYSGPSNHRDHVHVSQTVAAAEASVLPAPDPPSPGQPLEDDMPLYVHGDGPGHPVSEPPTIEELNGNGWAQVELVAGRKRRLDGHEGKVIAAARATVHTVPQADLDAMPWTS